MESRKRPSKRQLEIQLARLRTLENPSLRLEQYPVSPKVASELLYMAGFEHTDLNGRVIDLGTGTGRLAIGAALMGSEQVVAIDVDARALALAQENAKAADVCVEWVHSPIDKVNGAFDVALMNPPYGSRVAHADIRFLDKAFQLARTVYTIHKSSTRNYLANHTKEHGRRVDEVRSMLMEIPHLFGFHSKTSKSIEIDLYRIVD